MRVLVCGGRKFSNRTLLHVTLDCLLSEKGDVTAIIHGKATGADSLAKDWADFRGIAEIPFPAKWDNMTASPCIPRRNSKGKLYNAAAGSIRNQRMIEEGRPDLVVAFSGGKGTADMVRRARAAGIEVREIA